MKSGSIFVKIKKLIPGCVKKPLSLIKQWAFRESLTPSKRRFIRANEAFWRQYRNTGPSDGYVLIECKYDPVTLLGNLSHAAIVAYARKLTPLFMLKSRWDTTAKRIMESCPDSRFVYLDEPRYKAARKKTDLMAMEVYCSMNCLEDLINFEIDGIKFGNLIYDSVLYSRYATIRKIDQRVLECLREFFWCRFNIKDIISIYDIKTSIFSQTYTGLIAGTFTRYLLQSGIEVLGHLGAHYVVLKKYQKLDDIGVLECQAEPQYFELMKSWADNTVLNQANKNLEQRFGQRSVNISIDVAFDHSKTLFETREKFCTNYNLDPKKKLVFVMLHSFNDWPRSLFKKPMIYRDYCDWFENTLEIAKTENSVNWIFKEHPSAEMYPTMDLDLNEVFRNVQNPQILFLNYQADFNAVSLRHIADTIVTCAGTAGLEYSCMGTPCVLAGPSAYSGLGFTIEPKNTEEYKVQLRNLANLSRLNEEQVKTAKLALFFQYGIMLNTTYLFCPDFDYNKILENDPEFIWSKAAENMEKSDHSALNREVEKLAEFIKNRNWTQFVNLDKYPFLRGAVKTSNSNYS